jgi:hypothetical protein
MGSEGQLLHFCALKHNAGPAPQDRARIAFRAAGAQMPLSAARTFLAEPSTRM